jgi:hypothetical protein
MTPSGIELATFWLVAQYLNQPLYRVTHPLQHVLMHKSETTNPQQTTIRSITVKPRSFQTRSFIV